jgi:hypothetical protein
VFFTFPQTTICLVMASEAKLSSTFTDDKSLDFAFPPEFIPAEVKAAVPEDLHVCHQCSIVVGSMA